MEEFSQRILPKHTIIRLMSTVIENCMNTSSNCIPGKSEFDAEIQDNYTLEKYIHRIAKYTQAESYTLIYSLAVLDSFCLKSKVLLTKKNCFKLVLISLLISQKFLEDNILSHKDYALVGGVTLKELSILEAIYLEAMDYKVNLSRQLYSEYVKIFIN